MTLSCFVYFALKSAELAEYTAKITLLEEAKKVKEKEANQWQNRVIDTFIRSIHL